MPRLYLLRHAKSSWDDPDLGDHDRPLAPRGRRATKLIRDHVRGAGITPEVVLCSAAKRAQETLEGVRSGLAAETEVVIAEELYTFSATRLLAEIGSLPDDVASAMVIGHNPAMQELTLRLARSGAQLEAVARKFPTAGLATLETDCRWAELGAQAATLAAFVRPKELQAAN